MEKAKMEKIETVERTITVKLPREFDEFLQKLAEKLNRTPEKILLKELYSVLESFFEGGFVKGLFEDITDYDVEHGRKLENQVSSIADTVLDC